MLFFGYGFGSLSSSDAVAIEWKADLKGTPLPAKITWIPYDDKEPLHDWKALLK
jgi:hypothetical protein